MRKAIIEAAEKEMPLEFCAMCEGFDGFAVTAEAARQEADLLESIIVGSLDDCGYDWRNWTDRERYDYALAFLEGATDVLYQLENDEDGNAEEYPTPETLDAYHQGRAMAWDCCCGNPAVFDILQEIPYNTSEMASIVRSI